MSELTEPRFESLIAIDGILFVFGEIVHMEIIVGNPHIIIASVTPCLVNAGICSVILSLKAFAEECCVIFKLGEQFRRLMLLVIFGKEYSHADTLGTLVTIWRITVGCIVKIYIVGFVVIHHKGTISEIRLVGHLLVFQYEVSSF